MLHTPVIENLFKNIYGDDSKIIERQQQRYKKLLATFEELFGDADVHLFSTSGRTEIGGNHTDHNHGRVLAASVNLDSIGVVAKTNDMQVIFHSDVFDEPFCVDLTDLNIHEAEKETTASIIRGIAARFVELGYHVGGFQACVTSDVFIGSGLSSSASVEVLIGHIFSVFFNDSKVKPEQLALIGQYAENNYFGKPCGLMDQMTCAVGGIVTIDFQNPQQPIVKKINFDFASQNYRLVVVDTGGNHADLTEDYTSIPKEMKATAAVLGGNVVRDIRMDQLLDHIADLRVKVGDRAILRAAHFLMDNERVVDQVEALEKGDFNRFLSLVTESGNSSFRWLQNCYTIKAPDEQGVSLALMVTEQYLKQIPKDAACRVHGGGFAGTIQVFLPTESVADYVTLMESVFGKGAVVVLSIRPQGTVHVDM
ncbi:galactokinase [candidate division KSB1 bacterium]|nr:galactokinase [candidate division KSB1 bacterium]